LLVFSVLVLLSLSLSPPTTAAAAVSHRITLSDIYSEYIYLLKHFIFRQAYQLKNTTKKLQYIG